MFFNLIIFILIMVPISLFIHELGHLLGAIFLKADRVTIYLGIGKQVSSFTYKNMHVKMFLLMMFHAYTQSERKLDFTNREYAFITIMGPLFSLLLTGLIGAFLFVVKSKVILYFFLFNLWITVINLIPFKIKNQKSDGYLIWTLLK